MAVTVQELDRGATFSVHAVTATADADTDAIIPHQLGQVPEVLVTWTCVSCRLALWVRTAADAQTVTMNKTTLAGTGSPIPGIRVYCFLPPNLLR